MFASIELSNSYKIQFYEQNPNRALFLCGAENCIWYLLVTVSTHGGLIFVENNIKQLRPWDFKPNIFQQHDRIDLNAP